MIFVFDTTEFQDQKRLEGSLIRLFAVARNVAQHKVVVPQVVVDEHLRHVREEIETLLAELRHKADELARYTGKAVDLRLPDATQEVDRWRSWFVDRLRQWGFTIAPYPGTAHAELLMRDLGRRKPFDDKGRGYRDALLWESILELANANPDDVVLVSRNASDFGKEGLLHPDLVSDISARRWDQSRVRLANGLRAAVETYLQNSLPPTDPALATAIEAGTHPSIDLGEWLRAGLKGANPELTIGTVDTVGLPKEARLDQVKAVEQARVKEARVLARGDVFVLFEATVTAGLRWFGTLSVEPPPSVAGKTPSLAYAVAQLLFALTALIVVDESVHIEGALTFSADGQAVASDLWEARVVPRAFAYLATGSPRAF